MHKASVFFFVMAFSFVLLSCSTGDSGENNANNNPTATVNLFNESSFRVDVYKNLNPDYFDPTTLAATVNPGETKKVSLYASTDQVIGDTFYPRYKVLLADSFETGTSNIYVDAQRNLSNISLVVESGKTYTRTIPQPSTGDLKFINGYVKIQNTGSTQIQIHRADTVLYKLDNNGAYLTTGQNTGYYEITISAFDNTLNMNQLKAYSSSFVVFPAFEMERGKLYSFTVNNATVTGPAVSNIDPMRN